MRYRYFTATTLFVPLLVAALAAPVGAVKKTTKTTKKGQPTAAVATTLAPKTVAPATVTTVPAVTPSSAATSTPITVKRTDIDRTAVFRYGTSTNLNNWDPHKPALSTQDGQYLYDVYDRFLRATPAGDPVPGLATSWSYNSDGTQLTLKLRTGVKFTDGTAFDAAAAKANIERVKTVDGGTIKNELAAVSSVDIIDPSTIRLNLSARSQVLLNALMGTAGTILSPAAFTRSDLGEKPVGSGAYRLVEWVKGDHAFFEPNPGYWDPDAVQVARLEIYVRPDANVALNAVRSGQLDAIFIGPDQVDTAKKAGLNVNVADSMWCYYAQPQTNKPGPLSVTKVRQALLLATNRSLITDALFLGMGSPTVQLFPPGFWANNPNLKVADYGPDINKAKRLLEDAGYPNGFTLDGVVVTNPLYKDIAEVLQLEWRPLGVTLNVRVVDNASVLGSFFVRKEGDIIIGPWTGRADPSETITGLFDPTSAFSTASTPKIRELNAAALSEPDQKKRQQLIWQISQEVLDQALLIPITHPKNILVTSQKVHDMANPVLFRPELRGMYISK